MHPGERKAKLPGSAAEPASLCPSPTGEASRRYRSFLLDSLRALVAPIGVGKRAEAIGRAHSRRASSPYLNLRGRGPRQKIRSMRSRERWAARTADPPPRAAAQAPASPDEASLGMNSLSETAPYESDKMRAGICRHRIFSPRHDPSLRTIPGAYPGSAAHRARAPFRDNLIGSWIEYPQL